MIFHKRKFRSEARFVLGQGVRRKGWVKARGMHPMETCSFRTCYRNFHVRVIN